MTRNRKDEEHELMVVKKKTPNESDRKTEKLQLRLKKRNGEITSDLR